MWWIDYCNKSKILTALLVINDLVGARFLTCAKESK